MPPFKISKERIEFSFRDAAGGGPTIQSSKIGEIVRRMRFVASVGQTCDLQAFVKFCDSIVHPEDTFDNLVQFFRSYDSNNSGTITSQQLTSLLTNTGEVLTSKEIEILLKDFPSNDGGFNYENFLKELVR
ncbi:EF-hand domain pair family protein [Cryptosporidium meleagridis]|uniref:Calmodulin n=1 Tax=Cryptosporidium meleagridis TaxID=93969 RepID=A0A2P4YYT9_9CRYT|nr:EF-hand domain pair family protein [Cryptosporidium meleagridis]